MWIGYSKRVHRSRRHVVIYVRRTAIRALHSITVNVWTIWIRNTIGCWNNCHRGLKLQSRWTAAMVWWVYHLLDLSMRPPQSQSRIKFACERAITTYSVLLRESLNLDTIFNCLSKVSLLIGHRIVCSIVQSLRGSQVQVQVLRLSFSFVRSFSIALCVSGIRVFFCIISVYLYRCISLCLSVRMHCYY